MMENVFIRLFICDIYTGMGGYMEGGWMEGSIYSFFLPDIYTGMGG